MKSLKHVACPATLVACAILSGCGRREAIVCDDVVREGSSPTMDSVVKLDDYLYALDYTDYDFDELVAAAGGNFVPPSGACSELRKGDLIGRNMDWNINRQASAVIRVDGKQGRYASIGIVDVNPKFLQIDGKLASGDEALRAAPLTTLDGVNEKGFYIGVNVVPTGETSRDPAKWADHKWGVGAANTNPGAERSYCTAFLVRFVLDNAASVDEALELIKSVNWYDPFNFPGPGQTQSFHWMLADATSNAVVEFIDNAVVAIRSDDIRTPSYATLMTNFNNALRKEGVLQPHAAGCERWDVLAREAASMPETVEAMKGVMAKAWYTKTYTDDVGTPDFFFSEYVGSKAGSGKTFYAADLYGRPEVRDDPDFIEVAARAHEKFADKANWHTDDTSLWYTTHCCVYELSKRRFSVLLHEGLDGMKEWMTFELQ